jgi:Protein of unknown function (DUF1203)
MNFRITGLSPNIFSHLFGLPNDELANLNVIRYTADAANAFPCRISLQDAAVGDSLLLVNYEHQPARNAYQSSHAIYVNETARSASIFENELPAQMRRRLLSIRAFDQDDMMIDAAVIEGEIALPSIQGMLAVPETRYLHVHYAKRGCFAARVDRGH